MRRVHHRDYKRRNRLNGRESDATLYKYTDKQNVNRDGFVRLSLFNLSLNCRFGQAKLESQIKYNKNDTYNPMNALAVRNEPSTFVLNIVSQCIES